MSETTKYLEALKEIKEFKNLPSDTLIDIEQKCFICNQPINRKNEYLNWARNIEIQNENEEIEVLDSEEVLLICSRNCFNKLKWSFDVVKKYNTRFKDIQRTPISIITKMSRL